FSDEASQILSLCELNKIQGYVTPVIISNIYYLLRQTAKHEKVIENLKQLLTFIDVLIMDKNIIIQALNSPFKDFEDALQNYTAENNIDIKIIITRNIKDFKKSNLGVITPENYLKLKNASL
ncbi:MAG TPA: PIN domain-containing protein, partial [Bacteroidales bacterium]|nr:PIN domain-containing protein [Bacteroidales bacterium]